MTDDLFTKRAPIGADMKLYALLARSTALKQALNELDKAACELPGMVLARAIIAQMDADASSELSLRVYRAASKAGITLHEIAQIGTEVDAKTGEVTLLVTLEGDA